jgi:hypothetical protein
MIEQQEGYCQADKEFISKVEANHLMNKSQSQKSWTAYFNYNSGLISNCQFTSLAKSYRTNIPAMEYYPDPANPASAGQESCAGS